MTITGHTRVFYTIADPITQVRTPEVFNAVLPLCNIDAVMVPLHVGVEDLDIVVRSLFRSPTTGGIILSIPHKPAAAALVDHCSKAAATANAVNAIRRNASGQLEGELFDGLGFLKSLDRHGMKYRGQHILLIGAGGAASAIATALAVEEPARLALFDPDTSKAEQLAHSIETQYGVDTTVQSCNDPAGFDLVINASPLGLKPDDPLPVPVDRLEPSAQVCDILMKNQPTPLLRAAMARDIAVQPGFDMLILQTPFFFDFFGLTEAAALLRQDDSVVRNLLFPTNSTPAAV
ncbi:shikimate dehydrogenase [Paraburkholderia sp. Tr-20389]|uniref:shikimate dehydrogenase family protein n=1 Tax=Paraburkholderia sp. Tr-20389 TaxID=2703903 RepID=UPI001981A8D7|nr:shikimate dehydrogenase [Paraburkholderia sp. Tr-20389]MBN3753700.1 shikimate dehydrogenase [Paraburkholderia sp. Tr-20389]